MRLPMIAIAATLGLAACGNGNEADTTAETTATDPGLATDTTGAGNMMGDTGGTPGEAGSGAAAPNSMGTSGSSGAPTSPTGGTPVDSTMPPPTMEPTANGDPNIPDSNMPQPPGA